MTPRPSLTCETTFFGGLRALPAARRDITASQPGTAVGPRSCLKDFVWELLPIGIIVKNELRLRCCCLRPLCCVFGLVQPPPDPKLEASPGRAVALGRRRSIQMAHCRQNQPKFQTPWLKLLTASASNTSAAFCSTRRRFEAAPPLDDTSLVYPQLRERRPPGNDCRTPSTSHASAAIRYFELLPRRWRHASHASRRSS